jgi:DNA-directed RNA polymerase I subunit RPA2
MLVESMAGKSGSMNGVFQDATPFQFHEERKVIDYLGEQLRCVRFLTLPLIFPFLNFIGFIIMNSCLYGTRAVGYQYYGSEPLYNGLTGNLMQADIFMGVVFYQRLR